MQHSSLSNICTNCIVPSCTVKMFLSNILLGAPPVVREECILPEAWLPSLQDAKTFPVKSAKSDFCIDAHYLKEDKDNPRKVKLKVFFKNTFLRIFYPSRTFCGWLNNRLTWKGAGVGNKPELGLRFAILEIVGSLRNDDQPQLMPTDFGSFCFCCSWNLNKAIQLCCSKYANKGQIYFSNMKRTQTF